MEKLSLKSSFVLGFFIFIGLGTLDILFQVVF